MTFPALTLLDTVLMVLAETSQKSALQPASTNNCHKNPILVYHLDIQESDAKQFTTSITAYNLNLSFLKTLEVLL